MGRPAPPACRLAPGVHLLAPCCYVGSPPPPRLHLCRCLIPFDPRAHIRRSGLYILAPITPRKRTPVIKSFEKTETLIVLRAPPYSRVQLVRLGLEGGKQVSLGILIMLRAWFGIIFVPLSRLYLSLLLYVCYNCYDNFIHIDYVPSYHVHCLL